jgi:hypothetical protein
MAYNKTLANKKAAMEITENAVSIILTIAISKIVGLTGYQLSSDESLILVAAAKITISRIRNFLKHSNTKDTDDTEK